MKKYFTIFLILIMAGLAFGADKKITELSALTTPAGDDLLAVVDSSASTTKKITLNYLRTYIPYVSKTADYTVSATDEFIAVDATAGAITLTLPAVAGVTVGKTYVIKKTDAGYNAVTIDGSGAETIDGATTYAIALKNEGLQITSDGAAWQITGTIPSSTIDYSSTSSLSGWSGSPTKEIYIIKNRKEITVYYAISGTSNSTSFALFTVPNSLTWGGTAFYNQGYGVDNGSALNYPILGLISGTSVQFLKNNAGDSWTGSGTKTIQGVFKYYIN